MKTPPLKRILKVFNATVRKTTVKRYDGMGLLSVLIRYIFLYYDAC